MKIFCGGVGADFPDITGASRAMTSSEYARCQANGVTDITKVEIGYDGIVIAHSIESPDMGLTKAQLYLGLAANVPVDGEIVPNPYESWNEIDPSLPDTPVRVYGPPPTSGTRDAFVELVMTQGCTGFEAVRALPEQRQAEVCQLLRQDGGFIPAGENDNLIVQRLKTDPAALGIFGYSYLYENQNTLKAVAINGVLPTRKTIGSDKYSVARPLYIYIKNAHRGVIPGLQAFIKEYVSENTFSPRGYLTERGLIPLDKTLREKMRQIALEAEPMEAPGS